MSNNIVAFIPARGNSKTIYEKNLKLLGGKPLVAWSIESAQHCGFERIIVNTEDSRIIEIASQYNVFTQVRDQRLAGDNISMYELLRSEIFKIDPVPDIVLLLQPTSPFRNHTFVNIALSYLFANLEKYDSLVSVEKVPDKYHPYAMILENSPDKVILFRKLIGLKEKLVSRITGKKFVGPSLSGFSISQRITRRQDMPQCWLPDGSIYIFKTENLKKGSLYGEKVMLLESEGTININSQEDWENAEQIIQNKS